MHRPMQRKYTAKAAHGACGEQGKINLPYSIVQGRTEENRRAGFAAVAACPRMVSRGKISSARSHR